MRKNVYCTPKSFLSFIDMYKDIYSVKFDAIVSEEKNVLLGLDTIFAASSNIDDLKKEIGVQKEQVDELLVGIKEQAAIIKDQTDKAKKKAAEVQKDADEIMENKKYVEKEKEIATIQLQASNPILEEALKALNKVQVKELDEIGKTKPEMVPTIIKYCFDCVAIILSYPVNTVEVVTQEVKKGITVTF